MTKKKLRGVPELWDEVKKGVRIMLTPTAIAGVDELAQKYGLSRSEFVEQVGRRIIPVGEPTEEVTKGDSSVSVARRESADCSDDVEDESRLEVAA